MSEKMSDPVLSQLVSVEDDLSQQVETLEAQLSQLQAQRQGLQTVITLFEASAHEETGHKKANKTASGSSASTTAKMSATRQSTTTRAKSKPGRKPGRKKRGKPGPKPKSKTASAKGKKKDGRAAAWQKYAQPDYRESALPEAVSSVLRAQPSEIFKIADVMSSIFIEDMPQAAFLKARNRISNILSAGARDGTWYRGRNGRYSQSESVTKIK